MDTTTADADAVVLEPAETEMACCEDCVKVRSTEFIRVALVDLSVPRTSPYHSAFISEKHQVLVSFKALLRRNSKHKDINYKVGVIGSHGRIGQTAQGLGSMAIPGDYSNLRSPVRSRVYEALTPGGLRIPNVRVPNKPNRGFRCPEGFQFGGRFTDNRYTTCGQMLFDIPSLGQTISNLVRSATNVPSIAGSARVRKLGAAGGVDDVVIRRAAQIPRVGAEDKKKRASSIASAVTSLLSADDKTSLVVRQDGFTLMPVVSARVLRTIPDNRNMENGTYVMNVANQNSIGGEELGLLSNAGISEVVYALPNGSTISVNKTRQLSVGERRKLGRTVNSVSSMSTDTDPAARLRALVAEIGPAMSYNEDFKNIDNPNDMLDAKIGNRTVQVRRWVNDIFLKKNGRAKPTRTVEAQSKPSRVTAAKTNGLQDAVALLNDNKSPFDISSSIVSQALSASDSYKKRKAGKATIFTRADGKEFIETSSSADFQHLGERTYADVAQYLGVDAPEVGFVGTGSRRGILAESVDSAVDGVTVDREISPSDIPVTDVTKVAALDYLMDVRDRDETTLVPYKKANTNSIIAGMTGNAALAGLSPAEIRRREALKLEDFYTQQRMAAFKAYYRDLTDKQREQMLKTIDDLLTRAKQFSWEDYIARLTIDGELSDSEKRHLSIVQKIYYSRVDSLKSSRERFVALLGQ